MRKWRGGERHRHLHRLPVAYFVGMLPNRLAIAVKGRFAAILTRSVLALRAAFRMRLPGGPLTAQAARAPGRRGDGQTVKGRGLVRSPPGVIVRHAADPWGLFRPQTRPEAQGSGEFQILDCRLWVLS